MNLRIFTLCLFVTTVIHAAPIHRRALLVGINDYTAPHFTAQPAHPPAPGRDWPNLSGAVNDVHALEEMLVALYGFERHGIASLTDQAATRAAILQSLQQLVDSAAKDDIVLFYYAGHGSQVRNSLSDERDKLDESIVPADSRAGAPDIRDKELRPLFNRIIEHGARLTVILDSCHSGSGARGLVTGAVPRGVQHDLRDVADRVYGPRPERNGALVFSAAEDFDMAWETRDAAGHVHGAFSWALQRAMRDSSRDESAASTFERAAARLRAETPYQNPVMQGIPDATLAPLLGARTDHPADHVLVAVEKIQSDGTVVLHGGWANGLSVGSELRDPTTSARLTVTALRDLARSEARTQARPMPQTIKSGALLEVVGWAAPPDAPLRVQTPRIGMTAKAIARFAHVLRDGAKKRGVTWIVDPTDDTPTHLLRRGSSDWELLGTGNGRERIASEEGVAAAVAKLPPGSSLFVQLPAPSAMVEAIGTDGAQFVARPEDADYILVGRFSSRKLTYAWMRPAVKGTDKRTTALPLCTAWTGPDKYDKNERATGLLLRETLLRLRKIQAWNRLESPPGSRFPYEINMRRLRDGEMARNHAVIGNEQYEVVLRATMPPATAVRPRYVYVFVIDSNGKSTLLFPLSGSVENRFPLSAPPAEIALGEAGGFAATAPYGVDTFFLLTTDEPLTDPWILEWKGVRTAEREAGSPLEQLLTLTGNGDRAHPLVTPTTWSIEKLAVESLPPRTANSRK